MYQMALSFSSFSKSNREKLKYAIHFCKSIDTDDYARVNLPSGEGDASGSSDSGELSEAGESDQVKPSTNSDVCARTIFYA